ncbi:MAG: hypothetical protein FWB90_02745 [Fibromonadales bacterium]|nr:hypothetical protein [Fibromonadales bacterium]
MRKIIGLIVLSALAAFAQEQKIAVYVTGDMGVNEKKVLGAKIHSSFIKSGKYKAIERSEDFLVAALDDNGHINDLAKQFGASAVCEVNVTPAFGSYQVSARVINVENAEVLSMGEASSPLQTIDDLNDVSDKIAVAMFGVSQPAAVVAKSEPVQPIVQEQPKDDKPKNKSDGYFLAEYMFGDGLGFGIGFGKISESNVLFGLEFFESGVLSSWKTPDLAEDYFFWNLGLNLGYVYKDLPDNLQLIGGAFASGQYWSGNWTDEACKIGLCEGFTELDFTFGLFAKVRWHILQAGIKVFLKDKTTCRFGMGFMF